MPLALVVIHKPEKFGLFWDSCHYNLIPSIPGLGRGEVATVMQPEWSA